MINTPTSTRSLKRFDFFEKAVDGVRDTSLFGAVVSILSLALLALLLMSEFYNFVHGSMGSHLTVTTGHVVDDVSIHLHMTLPHVPCEMVKYEAENIRGGSRDDPTKTSTLTLAPPTRSELSAMGSMGKKSGTDIGCTISGYVKVARVGGELRIRFSTTHKVDLTHFIHDFSFGKYEIPGQKTPLKHSPFTTSRDSEQRIIYNIQAVPVTHVHRTGAQVRALTYSVRSDTDDLVEAGRKTRDRRPGIDFDYDFSPLMVYQEEEGQSFLSFLTGVCAIAGGVCTLARFMVGFAMTVKHTKKGD